MASASAVSRISRSPGRNTRTSPGPSRCSSATASPMASISSRSGSGLGVVGVDDGPVADLDGVRAAAHLDDTGSVEVRGEPLGVDRRRGDDDLEVGAAGEQLREVAEDEVDVEAALVGLVDDQRVVAREGPVAGQLGEQDAVGHQLDQGVLADLVGEPDLVARRSSPSSVPSSSAIRSATRARGQPPRLGVADHAGDAAAQVEADLGDLRGLTRAGLAGDDHDLVVADRGGDVVAAGGDGQGRGIGDARDGGAAGGQPGLGGVDRGDQGGERPGAVGVRPRPEGGVEAAAQALRVVRAQGGDALAERRTRRWRGRRRRRGRQRRRPGRRCRGSRRPGKPRRRRRERRTRPGSECSGRCERPRPPRRREDDAGHRRPGWWTRCGGRRPGARRRRGSSSV